MNVQISKDIEYLETQLETLKKSQSEMSDELAELKKQKVILKKFPLPCSLDITNWTKMDQFGFTEDLAKYAKETLINGLQISHSNLNNVTRHVSLKLSEKDGGHWACMIEPFAIETGWMLNNTSKGYVLSFKREKMKYIVFMYKLKVTE